MPPSSATTSTPAPAPADTRDRLLRAGAQLLDASQGGDVSTRAICELAKVQAPTLYHHFGSKQALLDEVVNHGFRSFLAERPGPSGANGAVDGEVGSGDAGARGDAAADRDADPIERVRQGWDTHVAFGLAHPTFYAHVYGTVRPGVPCGVVAGVEAMVLETLDAAARAGRLSVPPATAAAELVAASSGVILRLITQPPGDVDLAVSERVRDAILASVTVGDGAVAGPAASPATSAIGLAAALDAGTGADRLSPGEIVLLREWLGRLSAPN